MVSAAANAVGFSGEDRKLVIARSLMLALIIGMNGLVMARDLLSVYIFLEITAVSCFVLIAIDRKVEALAGSFKYFILSGLATFAMLTANGLVFMRTGSLSFVYAQAAFVSNDFLVQLSLVLYVIAFCVKAGVAPFHGWLPDAHASAPNAVSVLLSGIVIKVAGCYLIIRMMSDVFYNQPAIGQAFMALGAFSMVLGAFAAIGQSDMKRVLAFSSVSQMGYIVMAAGLATPLALIGAVIHIINHALFKSQLFVNAASVKEQTGTVQLDQLGGLAERMPVTGWTSIIALLSAAGVPPFSGFWSKLLMIMALVTAGQWVYAGIAVLMSLVTLAYFLILQRKVFFGKLRQGFEELTEARVSLLSTSVLLAGVTTLLGLLFPLVLVFLANNGVLWFV
jgi:multicomponent Na+:H+ antiporter subunit D